LKYKETRTDVNGAAGDDSDVKNSMVFTIAIKQKFATVAPRNTKVAYERITITINHSVMDTIVVKLRIPRYK
jgi:hypothetical protein